MLYADNSDNFLFCLRLHENLKKSWEVEALLKIDILEYILSSNDKLLLNNEWSLLITEPLILLPGDSRYAWQTYQCTTVHIEFEIPSHTT